MKERYEFAAVWIEAGDIRSLVQVAESARQSQITGFGRTTMLARDDVFDMKANKPRGGLWQPAILANIAGAATDKGSKRGLHQDCLRN